jgi:hypothetical protein
LSAGVGSLAGASFETGGHVTGYADVPAEIVAELRSVCLGLPEAYEEQAWVGTRWRVRKRTFAHVLAIDSEWPPAYARASAAEGPVNLLTFRSPGDEVEALVTAGHPFFKPQWAPDVVGMVLSTGNHGGTGTTTSTTGTGVDWDEVAELLTESYCLLAPKKLVKLVNRPP